MMNNADTREQSEFNMAISYLNRLNQLFYMCDEASMILDMYQWYHTLLALFRELSTEMKDDELELMNDQAKLLGNEVNVYVQASGEGNAEVTNELYQGLHYFELGIRKVMKTSGLQMKMKQDPRKALG